MRAARRGPTFTSTLALTFTAADWATPRIIQVIAADDVAIEGPQIEVIDHSTSRGADVELRERLHERPAIDTVDAPPTPTGGLVTVLLGERPLMGAPITVRLRSAAHVRPADELAGGYYFLTVNGERTLKIRFGADAGEIETALRAMLDRPATPIVTRCRRARSDRLRHSGRP